jgi:U3 small nucleolar RNA-associated protein 19
MQILHRPVSKVQEQNSTEVKKKAESLPVWRGEDVYDMDEPDPANSRALESSLWELSVFRNHADPTVAKYCSILDKDMTDRRKSTEVNIEEVLSASYSFMFDKEIKKRLKAVPTAVYPIESVPKHLLEPGEFAMSFTL